MIGMTDKSVSSELDPFLEAYDRMEKYGFGDYPSWVAPLRKAGIARFAEQGFPTTRWEDWRFTNVAPVAKLPFNPFFESTAQALEVSDLKRLPFSEFTECRLVFVDGHFSEALSKTPAPAANGVLVKNLKSALSEHGDLLQRHLGQLAREDRNPFISLNDAYFQDGVFVHVGKNKTFEPVIHLLFVTTGSRPEGASVQPRNLVLAEEGSQFTVLENYVSLDDSVYLTNAVNEFVIGDNAHVEHIKFQDESPAAYHLAAVHARIGRDSRFASHSIALGARLSRNNLRTLLDGEGLNCILNGLYLSTDTQLADHHMIVEHAKPRCESHEYFNGILDDHGRGVFHGRILVQPDAQKTDAKQTNKNLLLSDDATINTKPQLEIYADDVKCTHGATVGQLNEEAIFYLRSRGVGLDEARRMLVHAFAGEILDRIQCRPAREHIDELVWKRLETATHV